MTFDGDNVDLDKTPLPYPPRVTRRPENEPRERMT